MLLLEDDRKHRSHTFYKLLITNMKSNQQFAIEWDLLRISLYSTSASEQNLVPYVVAV